MPTAANRRLAFGRFEIRPVERQLLCDGAPVRLGARAFDVLLVLAEQAGRLVTKDALLDRAWPGLVVEEANIAVQVSALRRAIGPAAVATIPGLGYRFALVPDEPPAAVAPEPAAASRRTNVTAPAVVLIGREADLAALRSALAQHRLVTLVGAGGIGKTCLARVAAGRVLDDHPRGVWWVDLAALTDAEQLAPAIAQAAGLPLGPGRDAAALVRALAGQRLLLVLDNCEHLVDPAARLVRALLDGTDGAAVLATSQEALKLAGEQVLALDPLPLPPAGATLVQARESAALRLFEGCAAAADRRFVLTDTNVAGAVALCRRLDGLALAIEMAAARVPLLGLEAVGVQLAERLDRLLAPQRDAPSRHRTLRQTLDWSHALLGAAEAAVLRRLSLFAGSFRLEAAQVAAAGAGLDAADVADALAGLVDKSLVKLEQVDPPRYRLLETTRLYARERLAQSGEGDAARRGHLEAMAAVADAAEQRAGASTWQACLAAFAPDCEDFEQAFGHACEVGDAAAAAPLLNTLRMLDHTRGRYRDAGRRAVQAAGLLDAAGPRPRARLLTYIATFDWIVVPGHSKVDSAREAVALWRTLGDERLLHATLGVLANSLSAIGDRAGAEAALAEAQRLERADWPLRRRGLRLIHDGWVALECADLGRACRSMHEAVTLFERDGELGSASILRVELSRALLRAGRCAEAAACAEAAVAEWRQHGPVEQLGVALTALAQAAWMGGDTARAGAVALQALELAAGGEPGADALMTIVAALAAESGDALGAARLLGHLDAADPAAAGAAMPAGPRRQALAAIERQLDDAALRQALDEGARLDGRSAWRIARSVLPGPPA